MIYQLKIDRLRLYAYHGVMPQERITGANFYVSLEAEYECDATAYAEDQLEGTLNYADVAEVIRQEMLIPSNLLEHVAHRIAQKLLDSFPRLYNISLLLEKENPPIGQYSEGFGVKIHLNR